MYAVMMVEGEYKAVQGIIIAMMLIAWPISGGHFNPALTMGIYVAEKDFKGNMKVVLSMIVAQFAGAFFGLLLGFLSLIDHKYVEDNLPSNAEV